MEENWSLHGITCPPLSTLSSSQEMRKYGLETLYDKGLTLEITFGIFNVYFPPHL